MKRLTSIGLIALVSAGCPGLKRPPPSSQRAAAERASPAETPEASPAASTEPSAAATPALAPVDAFLADVAELRAGYEGFLAEPDRATWDALMAQLEQAENHGFDLIETSDDARVEDALIRLSDLRANLSEREP